jgi:hypothetical protein
MQVRGLRIATEPCTDLLFDNQYSTYYTSTEAAPCGSRRVQWASDIMMSLRRGGATVQAIRMDEQRAFSARTESKVFAAVVDDVAQTQKR